MVDLNLHFAGFDIPAQEEFLDIALERKTSTQHGADLVPSDRGEVRHGNGQLDRIAVFWFQRDASGSFKFARRTIISAREPYADLTIVSRGLDNQTGDDRSRQQVLVAALPDTERSLQDGSA